MILHCSYEELMAVKAGASLALDRPEGWGGARVMAPPEVVADLEALLPRLSGDLSIATLAEQQSIRRAVTFILEELTEQMDAAILDEFPAAEKAVLSYFDYAYVLTVLDRLKRMEAEMTGLIELMTGQPPTAESSASITFDD
jgi:hypothetical protein